MFRAIGISLFLLYALARIVRAATSDGYEERVDYVEDWKTGEMRERRVRLQKYTAFERWCARVFLVVFCVAVAAALYEYRAMIFR